MGISGTGHFSTDRRRFCAALMGVPRSFFSPSRQRNPVPNQKCGPDAPRQEFPPGWGGAGFRPACAGHKVWRDSDSEWGGTPVQARSNRRTGMNGLPGMRGVKVVTGAAAAVLLVAHVGLTPALADTIEAALVRAYQNNPQLNAQRATVRSTDENVPQALSGYRPRVALTASAGYQYTDTNTTAGGSPTAIVRTEIHGTNAPRSAGLTVSQTLFNGQQPANKTRAAEIQVSGSREALRVLEQGVLLSAATIYMDYLRDAAIVEVQRSNVRVLEQTLKQTRDRFNVGAVTRTDVAQSEAQLAAGKTQQLTAESNLTTTRANFRRIIGNEPVGLAPGSPVDRFLPPTLPSAVELSLIGNPNVTAAMFGIDVSYLQVKVAEGALFPTVSLQASVQHS